MVKKENSNILFSVLFGAKIVRYLGGRHAVTHSQKLLPTFIKPLSYFYSYGVEVERKEENQFITQFVDAA